MKFCDENPAIQAWASEAVKLHEVLLQENQQYMYPDFFIQYKDKKGKNKVELIEINPAHKQCEKVLAKQT